MEGVGSLETLTWGEVEADSKTALRQEGYGWHGGQSTLAVETFEL